MTSATPRLFRVSIAAAIAAAMTFGAASPALAGGYLKLGDIKGESTDKDHKGEIEVLSWSWGQTNSGGIHHGGGMGSGKVNVQDINVMTRPTAPTADVRSGPAGDLDGDGRAETSTPRDSATGMASGRRQHSPMTVRKTIDKASPLLMRARAAGGLTATVPAGVCRVGARYPTAEFGTADGIYRLSDVTVTACTAAAGGDRPMETLSLNFAKVE